ncbi:MAG: transposase [Blautia sp.]|nr:transposase [Blautia sp.]
MIGTNHCGQVTKEELSAIPGIADWQVNGKLESESFAFYNCITLPLLEQVGIFRPLYSKIGRPSTNPAILASALIYGKMKSLSDSPLVEEVLSSDATQIALGVYSSGRGPIPARTRRMCARSLRGTWARRRFMSFPRRGFPRPRRSSPQRF